MRKTYRAICTRHRQVHHQQTPAPTTSAEAPYGRVNIDTVNQNHIATTAYVKGAYNSAITGVNKLDSKTDSASVKIYTTWGMDPTLGGATTYVPLFIPQAVQIEL